MSTESLVCLVLMTRVHKLTVFIDLRVWRDTMQKKSLNMSLNLFFNFHFYCKHFSTKQILKIQKYNITVLLVPCTKAYAVTTMRKALALANRWSHAGRHDCVYRHCVSTSSVSSCISICRSLLSCVLFSIMHWNEIETKMSLDLNTTFTASSLIKQLKKVRQRILFLWAFKPL